MYYLYYMKQTAKRPETMTLTVAKSLRSEVENNQNSVRVGMTLLYIDMANLQRWEVLELFDGGFAAKDDYETTDFYFNELQYGWKFRESDKVK